MLFDLRGRRRRAVQAIYLTLAILMGGGLVFFGIGGDVSGGLFDAFSDRNSGGDGNDAVEQRIERNEQRLANNPNSERTLAELVRDHFQLAASQIPEGEAAFPEDARDDLRQASAYWQRYRDAREGNPDSGLASVALQIYDVGALNQPKQAQEAARILAEDGNDAESYLRLVAYAAAAGDTRTADLATQKAVDLAPKDQKKAVRQQAEQLKAPQGAQGTGGQGGG